MYSSQPSTAELLDRARAGKESAFADLFARHEPEVRERVHETLPDKVRDCCDTEDLVLETYLVALRRLDEFRSRRQGAFARWLTYIADMRTAEALRRPSEQPTSVEPALVVEPKWTDDAPVTQLAPAEPRTAVPDERPPSEASTALIDWSSAPSEAATVPAEASLQLLAAEQLAAEKRAAEKLAAEKLAAEKLAAEKLAAEKLAAEKLAAEKLAAEKLAAEKLAAEKLAAEKLAAEKLAAEKLAAEKLAAEKRAAEKLAAEKLAAEKLAAEKRAAEKRAAEKLAAEKLAAEKRAAEKRAAEKRAAEKRAAEKRAAEKRAAEKRAAEKRAAEKRAAEKRAAEKLAAEKLAAEKLAAEKLATEKAAPNIEPEGTGIGVLRLVEVDGLTLFAAGVRLGLGEEETKELYAAALGEHAARLGHEGCRGLADPAVAAALADMRERRDGGEPLTDEALVAEHPEIAEGIRAGLAAFPALRDALRGDEPASSLASPAALAPPPDASRVREMAAGIILGPPTVDILLPLEDLTGLVDVDALEAGADHLPEEAPDSAAENPLEVAAARAATAEAQPVSEDLSGLIEAIEADARDRNPTVPPVDDRPPPDAHTTPKRASGGRLVKYAFGATILAVVAVGIGVEAHLSRQRSAAKEIARQIEEERAAELLRAEQAKRANAEAELERERNARAEGTTALERERRERREREAARERERAAREALEGERDSELLKSRSALRAARALGLANASRRVAAEDSMLSLILAEEAADDGVLPQLYGPLHEALRGSGARWVRWSSGMKQAADSGAPARFEGTRFSSSGSHVLAWSSGTNLVTVWDLEGSEQALVRTGEDHIWTVEWSPSSDTYVIALGDGVGGAVGGRGSASVRDLAGKELAVLRGHTDDVLSAVYAPQGDRILTVSADGTARVWDREAKELASMPVAAEAAGGSAVFSHSGEFVLTAGIDGKVAIWTRDGEPITEFTAPGRLESARFTPAGDRVLAIAESGAEAQLLSLQGDLLTIFPSPSVTIGGRGPYRNLYAEFSPSGDRLLTASQDGVARLWALDGEPLQTLEGHAKTYLRAAFSPRGDRIVTASADGTARLWDLQGRTLAVLDQPTGAVTAAAFSPSGNHLLTLDAGGLAILSEIGDGEVPVLAGGAGALTRICVTSELIVTASTDHSARVYDLRGRLRAVLDGHRDSVLGVECSPDGDFVLTHSADGTAKLWHRDGDELATYRSAERDVWSATFSPDGKRVLLGCGDGKARLCAQLGDVVSVFDPATVEGTGEPERVRRARDRAIWSATFSADGSRVFTANGEGQVHVWDHGGGHLRKLGKLGVRLRHPRTGDGLLALTRGAWAWSLHDAGGEPVRAEVGVGSARFSAAGDLILVAGAKEARLLPTSQDAYDAAEFASFAHDDAVLGAVFSPDEERVATACADGTARVWSRDGTLLAVLRGHEGPVVDLHFTPDGGRLVTASQDGTARVWLIDGAALRALVATRVLRELSPGERRRFAGLLGDGD